MKPSCETFQDLIIAVFQGEPVTGQDRRALEVHLEVCHECRAFREDLPGILEGLKDDPTPDLPEGFYEEIKTSILGELAKPRSSSPWRRAFGTIFREPWGRGILVPALSGLCGLIVGMALATAWMHRGAPSQPFSPGPPAVSRAAAPGDDTTALLGVVEDYVGETEFFDSLSNQEIQALSTDLASDLPRPVLQEMENETG